ncbi:MAG: hypothetical protein JSS30_05050 [Verrucomicrobia bacterium]|nr:hypothetical protein [Verrucomicrobiota bacterium]
MASVTFQPVELNDVQAGATCMLCREERKESDQVKGRTWWAHPHPDPTKNGELIDHIHAKCLRIWGTSDNINCICTNPINKTVLPPATLKDRVGEFLYLNGSKTLAVIGIIAAMASLIQIENQPTIFTHQNGEWVREASYSIYNLIFSMTAGMMANRFSEETIVVNLNVGGIPLRYVPKRLLFLGLVLGMHLNQNYKDIATFGALYIGGMALDHFLNKAIQKTSERLLSV